MNLLELTVVLLLLCVAVPGRSFSSVHGAVTHRISGCDYFLVQTTLGYDLLEWYGGHDPDKGDTIVGNYESYGFHDVIDDTVDESVRVYTDDYRLSRTDALEKLAENCE